MFLFDNDTPYNYVTFFSPCGHLHLFLSILIYFSSVGAKLIVKCYQGRSISALQNLGFLKCVMLR